jgi:hypothetical protein
MKPRKRIIIPSVTPRRTDVSDALIGITVALFIGLLSFVLGSCLWSC